jgi:hypothetical protein
MATIKTVNKVSFLFGSRVMTLLQRFWNIKTMEEIGERLSSPTFEDIAVILYCAHENACFYMKKDLIVESADHMHFFIDEAGMDKVQQIIAEGFEDIMRVHTAQAGAKKKAVPK